MVAGVAAFCVVDGRGRALYEADFGSTARRVSVLLVSFALSLSLSLTLLLSRSIKIIIIISL